MWKNKIVDILKKAKAGSDILNDVSIEVKNRALVKMSEELLNNSKYIIAENAKDISACLEQKLSTAFIDRLTLNDKRIKEMAGSLRAIAGLKGPVGAVIKQWKRPNGLLIKKVRVPIGVIGIIYESRPDVTSDCIGLCLKSGNACILRGGSEAIYSNLAIHKIITKCLGNFKIPKECFIVIDIRDRKAVEFLLKQDSFIDLIIPRGGEGLIRYVTENSLIPVIKHYKGVCHLYVDKKADLAMALEIAYNAKVQRPGVCNAIEKMLVHKDIAERFLPKAAAILQDAGVELRGCERTRKIIKGIKKAKEDDWYAEYLDLILAVKVVDNLDTAIMHINKYGSHHSDAIVTDDMKTGEAFLNKVNSACVYHNASTRFTDGYEFGFGAEIGISTDKIHARGPMALEELCTYKYLVLGNGQIRH